MRINEWQKKKGKSLLSGLIDISHGIRRVFTSSRHYVKVSFAELDFSDLQNVVIKYLGGFLMRNGHGIRS